MHLDAADWFILRELSRWDVGNYPRGPLRVPAQELARRTGLHRNSVATRIRALRRSGVLADYPFDPHPRALGFGRGGYGFDGARPRSAAELTRALAAFPQVQLAVLALDTTFLHVWHEGDVAKQVAGIRRALGARRAWRSYDMPPPQAAEPKLSPLDWRLVLALRARPARSLSAIARELRVSARTVERRAQRLIDSGAGGMAPRIGLDRVEGSVFVEFVVTDGDARATASIARAFPDRVLGPFGPGVPPQVAAPMPSLAEAQRRRVAAEAFPGIRGVEMHVMVDLVNPPAFDAWLAARVADAQSDVARIHGEGRV